MTVGVPVMSPPVGKVHAGCSNGAVVGEIAFSAGLALEFERSREYMGQSPGPTTSAGPGAGLLDGVAAAPPEIDQATRAARSPISGRGTRIRQPYPQRR